jgi:hypothetical protein
MESSRIPRKFTTAIPDRFRDEREGVLRILARWERVLRAATLAVPPHSMDTR